MINLFVLLFAFTLMYLSIVERFRSYAMMICIQGFLLFGISFALLNEITPANLIFIVTETIVFKAIIVPWLLYRIIRSTNINRVHQGSMPTFYSIIAVTAALIMSIWLVYMMKDDSMDVLFFSVSLFGLFAGLLLIVTHKRIFSHMVGFLVLENAVFLFSLAIGAEMPMLINIGILLDIIMGILTLGIFITKINNQLHSLNSDILTNVHD